MQIDKRNMGVVSPNWSGHRANNFDFARMLFAVAVIFCHSYSLLNLETEPFLKFSRGQAGLGNLAVDGFFAISGFLICQSWIRSKSLGSFLKKRALRIYPGLFAANLFVAIVVCPLGSDGHAPIFNIMQYIKLVYNSIWFASYNCGHVFMTVPCRNQINGPMWTIAYEFKCYLLLATMGVFGFLERRTIVVVAWIGTMLLALRFAIKHVTSISPGHFVLILGYWAHDWPRLLSFFLAGTVFFIFRSLIPLKGVAAAIFAIACLVSMRLPWCHTFVLPTLGCYVLFWFCLNTSIPLHNFSRFGDFSYGTYLYGWPIQQLIVSRSGTSISPILLFILATPLAVSIGALSWHVVENPFLRLKAGRSTSPAKGSLIDGAEFAAESQSDLLQEGGPNTIGS